MTERALAAARDCNVVSNLQCPLRGEVRTTSLTYFAMVDPSRSSCNRYFTNAASMVVDSVIVNPPFLFPFYQIWGIHFICFAESFSSIISANPSMFCIYSPSSINAMLAAVNKLFRFLGVPEARVKYLRVQRKLFRQHERELTKEEYLRLL